MAENLESETRQINQKDEWSAFIIFPSISDGADVVSSQLVPESTLFAQTLFPLSFEDTLPLLAFHLQLPFLWQ